MPAHRLLRRLLCATTLGLLLWAAGHRAGAEERPPPSDAGDLPQANNAFAWDLYDAVRGGGDNLFFSPYSISAALWMTQEGARGDTARQMRDVLHVGTTDPGAGYRGLTEALRAPLLHDGSAQPTARVPAYEIHVANALWGQVGYPFHAPFLERLAGVYGAPLERLDFSDGPTARATINAWVERMTRDKIKDIVPEGLPPPQTRLAIANAIYFKAAWADPFSERATKEGDFHGAAGVVRAPLMHRIDRFGHADLGAAHAVELPYRGGTTSMVLLVPKAVDGLATLESALTDGSLADLAARLAPRRVDVKLPRFEFTRMLDLGGTLHGMGMTLPFDAAKADFSGMSSAEKSWIGAVLHKAFVAVDEEGTEAAAATVLFLKGSDMGPPDEPVVVHADRPFVFLIRHVPTGTVLFLGRVTDPRG